MLTRHYVIAESENREDLMNVVNTYWKEGYRPHGSISICFVPEHRLYDNTYVKERYIYAQVMMKKGV